MTHWLWGKLNTLLLAVGPQNSGSIRSWATGSWKHDNSRLWPGYVP